MICMTPALSNEAIHEGAMAVQLRAIMVGAHRRVLNHDQSMRAGTNP